MRSNYGQQTESRSAWIGAIAAVNYDEQNSTLDVEFREGETYRYLHVPEFVYRELLKAESAGAFWNAIKNHFENEKVE